MQYAVAIGLHSTSQSFLLYPAVRFPIFYIYRLIWVDFVYTQLRKYKK